MEKENRDSPVPESPMATATFQATARKPTLIPDTFSSESIPDAVNIYDFTQIKPDQDREQCVVAKLSLSMYQKLMEMVEQKEENDNQQVKGSWTAQEDEMLLALVKKHGPRRWSFISKFMKGRVGKQCRERYLNHLDPRINKGDWSEAEDKKIVELHETHGNQWARIARFLDGRTANSVKNHWNSTLRRKLDKQLYSKHVIAQENHARKRIKPLKKRKRQSKEDEEGMDTSDDGADESPKKIPTRSSTKKKQLTIPVPDNTVQDEEDDSEPQSPPRQRRRINLADMAPSPGNGALISPNLCISPKGPTPSSTSTSNRYKNLFLEVDQLPTGGPSIKSTGSVTWASSKPNGQSSDNMFLTSPSNGMFIVSPKTELFSPAGSLKFGAQTPKLP